MRRVIEVPSEVRAKALALGGPGQRWLAGLAEVIEGLERDWDLTVGATLRGGSEAYVAEATTGDGEPAILKLALPGEWVSHEIETLLHARGRGYVRLLRHDESRQAMLLERLGPRLSELGLPVRAQLEIICSTLRRSWAMPAVQAFQSGANKAASLAEFISATWHELDEPCAGTVVERACSFADARRLEFDPATAVLVHGDAHADNTLRALDDETASDGPFKLVDPDGLFAEPACDLAVPMREYSRELLEARDTLRAARERCALLSSLTGADPRAIWEWGYMERASTGLLALRVGSEQVGRDMLAVAEALVSLD